MPPTAAYAESVNAVTSVWPARAKGAAPPGVGFAEAAERHLDDVYRYVLYMTKNPTLAEDLTGATFERALSAWGRFDPRRGSALTWLCQLARTVTLDHFRADERRRRREERFTREELEGADEIRVGAPFSPPLERALSTLSAADREVVALRVLLDLDATSAARVLGISQTACSTRLNRALDKLKEKVTADALA
jgi:RNA polymerase sigma-70 factor (ECF subfamily)